jgi:prophage DNA circulation protein
VAITKHALNEAVTIGTGIVNNLLASLPSASSNVPTGTSFVTAAGNLIEDMASEIAVTGAFWADLASVFDLARQAGMTYAAMDSARATTEALSPAGNAGQAIQDYAIQISLVGLSQILAATVFVSRDAIDASLVAINAAFLTAIETAANNFDWASYQTLIALRGAVALDLNSRAQTLPRILFYNFPSSHPALWLSQRIYGDGSRGVEIALENGASNPLFLSGPIRALSS